MRVHLIDAGGTITSVVSETGALQGAPGAGALEALLPPGLGPISIEKVHGGLSESMTFGDFAAIAQAIRKACEDDGVVGVVVAHGTDTMEESAYYADLLHDCSRPVVFTGAQRAAHDPDFDGYRNLRDAAALARHEPCRHHGVLVVFGGLIIPAAQASKFHLLETEGFRARDGNSGRIRGAYIELPRLGERTAPFAHGCLEESVALITLSAGMSGKLIDLAADEYRGIVIAGLGSGNAPQAVCDAIDRAMARGVVVALGTRCLGGNVAGLYSSGHRLIESGAIALGSLPAPQARILLSTILEQGGGSADAAMSARAIMLE